MLLSDQGEGTFPSNYSISYGRFRSFDGLEIRFCISRPFLEGAQGVVLVLNGRKEFMEKYREVFTELHHLKFVVCSLDWRGQGLSGRELPRRHRGYVKTFDAYLKDLEILYNDQISPFNLPVFILSHSMGGHLALRFMHDHPGVVKKAVLVSPMINIVTAPFPGKVARRLSSFMVKAGYGSRYIPGGKDYSRRNSLLIQRRLTHDPKRQKIESIEVEKNPDLGLGGATWAWLKAGFESMDMVMEKAYAAQIKDPVLVINAAKDRVVCRKAQQRICSLLFQGAYVSIPGAFHEVLHETDRIRSIFWEHFKRFVFE